MRLTPSIVARWPLKVPWRPAVLVALTVGHGLLYLALVPPWQAPDEPTQFEYAALVARLGRVPTFADSDAGLEQQIATSLTTQGFFTHLGLPQPPQAPRTLDDVRATFFMPRQVGGDPPLYYLLAALPLRLLMGHPIEAQLLSLRLLNLVCTSGAVLCAYSAALALLGCKPFALTVGLVLALHPMFVFIGSMAGNDALANLIGAASCWCGLALLRRRTVRLILALAGLIGLGVATKRTLLLPALLVGLLGCFGLLRWWLCSGLLGWLRGVSAGAALALLAVTGVALAWGYDPDLAGGWHSSGADQGVRRVGAAPGTGGAALYVPAGQVALQALPDVGAEWAQNYELRWGARLWTTEGTASGRLVIDYGWAIAVQPFTAAPDAQHIVVTTFVPLFCPYVHMAIFVDTGAVYVDQTAARSAREPALNLLTNSDLSGAGYRPGAVAPALSRALHLRELGWAWRSGRLAQPPPLGWDLGRAFFASFWGQFGWMSVPLVGGTPWEPVLGLVCAGSVAGLGAWWLRPGISQGQRLGVALLVLFVLAGLAAPLLNAYTQPRAMVIQQGRYLFPCLAPFAILLCLGWRTLLPAPWRPFGLAVAGAGGLALATAALNLMVRAYA